ncbi:MAG: hypothetical protein Q7R50_03650, partial [Dehalococcoidales bacterium]|nr:hypothetical protein [Dehalococcoidales bacterium]
MGNKSNHIAEWLSAVPGRWLTMALVLLPLIGMCVAGTIWLLNNGLPLYWVISGLVVIVAYVLLSYLAYHKVAIERDEMKHALPPDVSLAIEKTIIDKKLPLVFEITTTLQKMADYQNTVLEGLFRKQPKTAKVIKIQHALQLRLQIIERKMGISDDAKINVIQKELKRIGGYDADFTEGLLPFMVAITWVLHDFELGIPERLTTEYKNSKILLGEQTKNLSSSNLESMIIIFEDLAMGFNSTIACIHYFPKQHINNSLPSGMSKSIQQLTYERDQILK